MVRRPVEAADAVVDVDDEVALGEAGRIRDEVGGAALLRAGATSRSPRMSCSPITASVGGLEAALEAEDGDARRCRAAAPAPRARSPPASAGSGRGRPAPGRSARASLRSSQATMTRFPSSPGPRCGAMAASKTLTSPAFRSAAKVRPRRAAHIDDAVRLAAGRRAKCGRSGCCRERRSRHSAGSGRGFSAAERPVGGTAAHALSVPALDAAPRSGRQSGRAARPAASSAR